LGGAQAVAEGRARPHPPGKARGRAIARSRGASASEEDMKATGIAVPWQARATPKPHFLDGLARRAVRARRAGIEHGSLALVDGDRAECFGKRTARCALNATVRVHDPRFYGEVAFGGSIGAGEAYMQGCWSTDDLTALMRILLQNRGVLDG